MDLQVHLCHKYGSFHHNFSLPVEPQVWNQYVSANEWRQFWSENEINTAYTH
jgi:hypothetical protein